MQLTAGTKVRHFKGGEYEIVGVGRHSETDERLVVYRPLATSALAKDESFWIRPISLFTGTVERPDYSGPRFTIMQ